LDIIANEVIPREGSTSASQRRKFAKVSPPRVVRGNRADVVHAIVGKQAVGFCWRREPRSQLMFRISRPGRIDQTSGATRRFHPGPAFQLAERIDRAICWSQKTPAAVEYFIGSGCDAARSKRVEVTAAASNDGTFAIPLDPTRSNNRRGPSFAFEGGPLVACVVCTPACGDGTPDIVGGEPFCFSITSGSTPKLSTTTNSTRWSWSNHSSTMARDESRS